MCVCFKVGHIAFIRQGITLEYNMGIICVPETRLDLTTSRLRVGRYIISASEATQPIQQVCDITEIVHYDEGEYPRWTEVSS